MEENGGHREYFEIQRVCDFFFMHQMGNKKNDWVKGPFEIKTPFISRLNMTEYGKLMDNHANGNYC